MKIRLKHSFEDIISLENFLAAWDEFILGKRNKQDVREFARNLMDNISALCDELKSGAYKHGGYYAFSICDPKPRQIHKASVRDRLLHHAIHRIFYPFFEKTFIADSFSCRNNKGTHKAINRFRSFVYRVSRNNIKTCWVLKCDIKKFFANIDHQILSGILQSYIFDQKILWLLNQVIQSFRSHPTNSATTENVGKGLPLGNLTSQLFSNIYMNKFDQFVKHNLKAKHYIRYADDFVILSQNKKWLEELIPQMSLFLREWLKLNLHPDKTFIKTLASGVDFLGWIHFSHHQVLRKTTKKRMMARIKESGRDETVQSYLGLLGHGDAFKLRQEVLNDYWLWKDF